MERHEIIKKYSDYDEDLEKYLGNDEYYLYQALISGKGYIYEYEEYIKDEDFGEEELADLKRKFDDGWIFIGQLSIVTNQWTLDQIQEMEEDIKKAG